MKTTFAFGSVIFFAAAITPVVAVRTSVAATAAQDSTAIRPFTVPIVPQAALDDLRRRIAATRWPDQETVTDDIAGRAARDDAEARALLGDGLRLAQGARRGSTRCRSSSPNIDGLDIHFIHVRSKHENALPMIVTHGWPGSIIEQMKIIDPLTNPTAHGGKRSGRLRCRDSVAAGLRLLRQADGARMEPGQHRARRGRR